MISFDLYNLHQFIQKRLCVTMMKSINYILIQRMTQLPSYIEKKHLNH